MIAPLSPGSFSLEGENERGEPKWLLFPCQSAHADPEYPCRVSINGQRNGVGATWTMSGPIDAPTVSPSVHCKPGGKTWCHFHIVCGRIEPC